MWNICIKAFRYTKVFFSRKLNTLYQCDGYPVVGCTDEYSSCQAWANTYNYCSVDHVEFMMKNCCESCRLAKCKDDNSSCGSWASSRFCKGTYEVYMVQNCKKSCRSCWLISSILIVFVLFNILEMLLNKIFWIILYILLNRKLYPNLDPLDHESWLILNSWIWIKKSWFIKNNRADPTVFSRRSIN